MNDQMKADFDPENQSSEDLSAVDAIPEESINADTVESESFSEKPFIVQEIEIPAESVGKAPFLPSGIEILNESISLSVEQSPERDDFEKAEEKEIPQESFPENSTPLPEEVNFYEEAQIEEAPALSPEANAFDWIKTFLVSLAAVIFIFTLIFRGVTVNGDSMLPTLHSNEYLIISDLIYTPKTGDIVVVQSPHFKNGTEPLIKRIIATGGQEVTINFATWSITVDGVELKEDYITIEDYTTMRCEDMIPDENGEVHFTVEDDSVFVMGDNRNDSLDSRSESVGQINERYIMGRVLLRITPLNRFGKVK